MNEALTDHVRRLVRIALLVSLFSLLAVPTSTAGATGTGSPCPLALAISLHQVVVTPSGNAWALCAGQGGVG